MSILAAPDFSTPVDRRRAEARARRLTKRAETLADAGRVAEAIACQSEVASLLPDDPMAFLRLGHLFREARCVEPALTAFRHASGLNPAQHDSREALLETLMEASRFAEVITEGRALAKLAPRNLFAREVLCIAYLQTGHVAKAVETTNELVWLDPSNPAHRFKRGMLLQQQGHLSAAVDAFVQTQQLALADSEIFDDAYEALCALEDYQLRMIMLLAMEDRFFDLNLRRDILGALESRGFSISENGVFRLRRMLQERGNFPAWPGSHVPHLYN